MRVNKILRAKARISLKSTQTLLPLQKKRRAIYLLSRTASGRKTARWKTAECNPNSRSCAILFRARIYIGISMTRLQSYRLALQRVLRFEMSEKKKRVSLRSAPLVIPRRNKKKTLYDSIKYADCRCALTREQTCKMRSTTNSLHSWSRLSETGELARSSLSRDEEER